MDSIYDNILESSKKELDKMTKEEFEQGYLEVKNGVGIKVSDILNIDYNETEVSIEGRNISSRKIKGFVTIE